MRTVDADMLYEFLRGVMFGQDSRFTSGLLDAAFPTQTAGVDMERAKAAPAADCREIDEAGEDKPTGIVYTKDLASVHSFSEFRKKVTTKACRLVGPFGVHTREGILHCEDGWLALDASGFPYPIAADEFDRLYEPVPESGDGIDESMYSSVDMGRVYRVAGADAGRHRNVIDAAIAEYERQKGEGACQASTGTGSSMGLSAESRGQASSTSSASCSPAADAGMSDADLRPLFEAWLRSHSLDIMDLVRAVATAAADRARVVVSSEDVDRYLDQDCPASRVNGWTTDDYNALVKWLRSKGVIVED